MLVLVAYDVSDDAKRERLAKVLASRGERRQLSVFLVEVSSGLDLQKLKHAALKHVDLRRDRCCFVPICHDCRERSMWLGAYPDERGGWSDA